MPPDLERVALWWGPGILVLMAFGFGGLRLAHYWIEKSMDVKRRQMEHAFDIAQRYIERFLVAQNSQADAFTRLATTVEQRDSIESFEHREMFVALKALHREVEALARSN